MPASLAQYSSLSNHSKALRTAIHHAISQSGVSLDQVAVAVSGGPDSAMMAVELAVLGQTAGQKSHIFHVHHGLQHAADQWRNRVHKLADIVGLPCHSMRVSVSENTGKGTESAARDARYQGLKTLANQIGVQHVLLAQHRDDQAETVLLRLLRGSGPAGLAAMAPVTTREGLTLLRPWLAIPRATVMQQMQCFFMATGWAPVYDPTNHHDRYTRSALRERLVPALNQRWNGWQKILSRHARHAGEVAEILTEVAAEDFASLDPAPDHHSFSLLAWRALSPARQAHVLRYWLATCGLRAPTEARLNDVLRQLRQLHALGHDRQMRVRHAGADIGCHKGRVQLRWHDPPAF